MQHPLLQPDNRLVIGHRGNAMFAPENTLPSLQQAVEAGADAVEIDVHLTADGEVVVIHDPTVDRTTNGTGLVAAKSLAELRELDAGARFTRDAGLTHPYREQDIRIPTLVEALRQFPSIPFVIEIKAAAAQKRVIEIVSELDASGRVVLASFDPNSVTLLRSAGLSTGASRPELFSMYLRAAMRLSPRHFDFEAVFMPRRYWGLPLSIGPVLRAASGKSITVHTWVENDTGTALKLWNAGVSGVVTDDPASLVRVRNGR